MDINETKGQIIKYLDRVKEVKRIRQTLASGAIDLTEALRLLKLI